ncbi:hypothetical protein AMTR_s00003p00246230 [Amborella trichopoda]|uniref:Uncharacterized protein n=1 Tax=Amborella trichopoda TaxID=13333 RepID=W1P0J7_AMBTC|nr:hypothetical protein AMTR_s00003p00246230 [Amborella trichopoda]
MKQARGDGQSLATNRGGNSEELMANEAEQTKGWDKITVWRMRLQKATSRERRKRKKGECQVAEKQKGRWDWRQVAAAKVSIN